MVEPCNEARPHYGEFITDKETAELSKCKDLYLQPIFKTIFNIIQAAFLENRT